MHFCWKFKDALLLEIKQMKLRIVGNIRPSLVNSTNIILTSRGGYEKKKKKKKKPDKNRIIYSWEAVYFQYDRMFRDRPMVETGEIHQFFFWIHDDEIPVGETAFFYLIVIQYEVVNIWNRSSIEISRVFSFSYVYHYSFLSFSIYTLVLTIYSFTIDNIWEGKGFRRSYASEISINMTNNLFTNYFLRAQYLF